MPFLDVPNDIEWRIVLAGSTTENSISILSLDEMARLETFAHSGRRQSFLSGRIAARGLLAKRINLEPSDVPLAIAEDEALVVDGHALHVSISHAGRGDSARSMAAIGERPIGVDLEEIVPRRADLYKRILQEEEYGLLNLMSLPHNEAQLLLFSLKEAVLKGLRTGFRRSAQTVWLDDLSDGKGHAHVGDGPSWNLRYTRLDDFWVTLAFLDQ